MNKKMNTIDENHLINIGNNTLDCLFVHAAALQTFYPPLNVYHSCNRMSLGLLALADLIHRNGYKTRVVHTGIENALDQRFSFSNYVQKIKPKAIGFSLQFHHGIVDTLQLVKEVEKVLPDTFIFLGGFTATYFAKEIMATFKEVDAVIRGDSEKPLLMVLEKIIRQDDSSFTDVPNIIWRDGEKLVVNKQTYSVDEKTFNNLDFTNFDLLDHKKQYVGMSKAYIKVNLSNYLSKKINNLFNNDRSGIYWGLPVGRGCVYNCFYCGGGATAQNLINKRKKPIFLKPEKVFETIIALKKMGFSGSYVSFDPGKQSRAYYINLFRLMQERRIKFDIIFSAWSLASKKFLEEFAKIKGPNSAYMVSPETGNEELRRKALGGHRFSNRDLLDNLAYADRLGIPTTIYFSIGALEKNMEDFNKTLALRDEITRRIKLATVEAFLIEVEPGAPWHINPEKYNIRLLRSSFKDFIRDHSRPFYSSMTDLGYTTGIFGDKNIEASVFNRKLLKLKCNHFCDKRFSCNIMSTLWPIGRLMGLVPKPRQRII